MAVKVQYPGVAKSIDSDIRNLLSLLSVAAILPPGLFIDNIAQHMKLGTAIILSIFVHYHTKSDIRQNIFSDWSLGYWLTFFTIDHRTT